MENDMVSKVVEELGANTKYQDVSGFAEKTVEITSKIQTLCKKIDNAKTKHSKAKKMDTTVNYFQKQFNKIPIIGDLVDSEADKLREQNQLIMEVDEMQNSAIMELNNLMQEMINFGCATFINATIMVCILGQLLEYGKLEKDGQIIRLTENTKKHLRNIRADIQSFLNQHQEHHSNIEQIKIDMKGIKDDIKKNEEDIGLNRENINQNKQSIVQNQQNIGQNKENIEKNRSEIETLHLKLKDKENIDNVQEQEIKNLKTKLENLEAKVDKKGSFIPYLFSAFALLIAIISLAMNFIDFTK